MRKIDVSIIYCLKVCVLFFIPLSVNAHTGIDSLSGLVDGFSHPFLGIDHLLVMIMVGLLAVINGGYRLWLFPIVFLIAMSLGALFDSFGIEIEYMEQGVAFSVLLCGFVLLISQRLPVFITICLISLFAIAHGYVHASEISDQADKGWYFLGLFIATALLHCSGIALGFFSTKIVTKIKHGFVVTYRFIRMAILVSV